MTILIILSLLLITSYVMTTIVLFGLRPSISDTYNQWEQLISRWGSVGKTWFCITMMLFPIPLIIVVNTWTVAIAGILIMGVGGIPAGWHSDKAGEWLHVICATGGIAMLAFSLIFNFGMYYKAAALIIFTILMLKYKVANHTTWIEIAAIYFAFDLAFTKL